MTSNEVLLTHMKEVKKNLKNGERTEGTRSCKLSRSCREM